VTGRHGKGRPDGGRFAPQRHTEADSVELEGDDAITGSTERKRHARLPKTLSEVARCLDDGQEIVALGKQRFDDDWIVQRAAKNVVTEFAETANRLPIQFRENHPDVPWRAVLGMRNRVVHVYERTDPEIVWAALAFEFPAVRSELEL